MNNNATKTQNTNKPQRTGSAKQTNKGNLIHKLSINRLTNNKANNAINEIRANEELKIKENLELLPEWLSTAVQKINGTNYVSNPFFIESYQKISLAEMEYFDQYPDQQSVNAATSLYNEARNRYMNVYPFDFNRVKLLNESKIVDIPEEETSDFINASIITNPYTGKDAYIATQGPIKETCSDFWQMVWERNIYLVVMVAREIENNILKCAIYWPIEKDLVYEVDLPSQYNTNTVQRKLELVLKETIQPTENIIKRVIQITEIEVDKTNITEEPKKLRSRDIIHLQFIAWPDHDEPNSISSFIDLIKLSKEIKTTVQKSDQYTNLEKSSLPVVHCSAGVGRTGTFITLNILFDFYYELFQKSKSFTFRDPCLANIQLNSIDKIQECIVGLRKQRVMMVQSLQQLVFCYKALAYELIQFQLKE
ncbi:hypothetical protein BCR32DRAFT_234937 [Anaeromyces robustus]|uniref:Phosphatases II n=1 Tax=Anaeromyces robustus TaxID=1754192 RepID=A0A1Y1WYV0_9FUNG|nr:hypothetical protein BCR32DRAFT_234937 [Anaeromyces robustus]|eukprot:ORX78612.1 hypothetical protein BCR32DRAFT_234937 [Anaeromyces robustus]